MATSSPVPDRFSSSVCCKQWEVCAACNESHFGRDGPPIEPRLSPQPDTDAGEPRTSSAIRPPGTRGRQAAHAICQGLVPATFSVCRRKAGALIWRIRYLQAWHLLLGAGPGPFPRPTPHPRGKETSRVWSLRLDIVPPTRRAAPLGTDPRGPPCPGALLISVCIPGDAGFAMANNLTFVCGEGSRVFPAVGKSFRSLTNCTSVP